MRILTMLLAWLTVVVAGCDAAPDQAPQGATETTAGRVGYEDIPLLVQDVGPSVVSIEVTVERQGRQARGAGSGVVWSEDGVVVTNAHVVREASEIVVVFADGERFPAELVAADGRTDLAALRVDRDGLPAATFADRQPEVGELVVALGNPLGFQNSATAGIVSGLDRELPPQAGGSALVGLIQTDAPISSGNSGGALVDGERQVVGINVAAITGAQGRTQASNLGFAIPATTVRRVVPQLLGSGEVTHPYLGIRGGSLTPQLADRFGIDAEAGVFVARVDEGGPAAEAGLQRGDVIVSIEDADVRSFGDLAGALRDHSPGDTVTVTVRRDGEERDIEVRLGDLPRSAG